MDRHHESPTPLSDTSRTAVQSEQDQELSRRRSLRAGAIPSSVGSYDILQNLGEGSFGTVWLARERKTGREVAIKFFTNRRGLDWTLLTREVEKLAVLDASRDVVRLLDVGVDHDPPYFVMEYLPHRSVATPLESGAIPIPRAVAIATNVARALVHAHSAGILHCDIKPGNVLLDRANEARLGDFGQSRLVTDQGSALGTFYYMAPEQAQRDAVPDVRWDVYALGALLYHMVTGSPPYRTDETEKQLRAAGSLNERLELYRNIIEKSEFPVDHRAVRGIDNALVELIDYCLQRDPSKRAPNPQVILDAIEKRELNRAKRPLILLGLLGPVLFLIILTWVASRLVPEAVTLAESRLAENNLISNTATARLLAWSVDQELMDRQAELERLASRLAPREGETDNYYGYRADVFAVIDAWQADMESRFVKQGRNLDESIFLTDATGMQIYRIPFSDSIGRTYSYHDYFHGQGRDLRTQTGVRDRIPPRTTAGVSRAFTSSNTGLLMVAVAAPVWNREKTEVIGVIARTLHLTDLLDQWESRIGNSHAPPGGEPHERLLALVDLRENPPILLDHDWLTAERAREYQDRESELRKILRLKPEKVLELQAAVNQGRGIHDFEDILMDQEERYEGTWLAAVAGTPNIDWITIVQERRDDAVKPMEQLNQKFLRYGLLMAAIFAAMLVLLWRLIQRAASH